MLLKRNELEAREDRELAAYAMRSAGSRGRLHPESAHEFRTAFARDRDRVLHSRAFRRLEYKTQVFINGTADHYRTRLTHTMEMAAVGRTMARVLGANEDLTEAIILAHDIGHSPFGHCGEEALDSLMKNEGGFDHNVQSCRWVEYLELQYPDFPGLNLTWEVRAGLRKHVSTVPGAQLDGHPIGPFQFVEAQIADLADDMTYHAHDVDDGIESGLVKFESLSDFELWRKAHERARTLHPSGDHESVMRLAVRNLLDIQVEDALQTTAAQLEKHRPAGPDDVMNAPERIVTFSPAMKAMLEPFRAFLFREMYWHPTVAQANREAVDMMRRLFLYYVENPSVMGRKARARIPVDGVWRTACDYLSGMTDRYAFEEFQRFVLGRRDGAAVDNTGDAT